MLINKVDNTNFGALIRIKKPQEFAQKVNNIFQNLPNESKAVSGSSSLSASTGISTVVPVANTAASGSNVIGSAFFAKASGVDSFGIVPSVLAKMSPYSTPATIESSMQNPSITGSLFSTVANWIHSHFRIKVDNSKKVMS